MNEKTITLWFFIMLLLFGTIAYLGFKEKANETTHYELMIKKTAKKFLSDKDRLPKVNNSEVVFISELIDNNYLKEDEILDECLDSVTYTKGLIVDKYELNVQCVEKIIDENVENNTGTVVTKNEILFEEN